MPVPHDYYDPHSPDPHLHNKHNHAPYIEPDWQANAAKDQLPDLSTIGRGPRGIGLYVADVKKTKTYVEFTIAEDLNGEPIATIGPFANGSMKVYAQTPDATTKPGQNTSFCIDYTTVDANGNVVTKTQVLEIPAGAEGSRIYATDEVFERSDDNVYVIEYSKIGLPQQFGNQTNPRVGDIILFETHGLVADQDEQRSSHWYLTWATIVAVSDSEEPADDETITAIGRTYMDYTKADLERGIPWDAITDKPDFATVATTGSYKDLSDKPITGSMMAASTGGATADGEYAGTISVDPGHEYIDGQTIQVVVGPDDLVGKWGDNTYNYKLILTEWPLGGENDSVSLSFNWDQFSDHPSAIVAGRIPSGTVFNFRMAGYNQAWQVWHGMIDIVSWGNGGAGDAHVVSLTDLEYADIKQQGLIDEKTIYVITPSSDNG